MLAGFLRGEPVELTRARTVALDVPSRAEIVLEGYCERGELRPEGPFGDHTGYYTPVDDFPVFRLTAMTMRRDAIYPSIVVGPPPMSTRTSKSPRSTTASSRPAARRCSSRTRRTRAIRS